jgi:hypothetical protein
MDRPSLDIDGGDAESLDDGRAESETQTPNLGDVADVANPTDVISEFADASLEAGNDSANDEENDGDADAHPDGQPPDAQSDADGAPAPTDADAASDAAPRPTDIAGSHLRLWLTADWGVTCTQTQGPDGSTIHRVSSWADRSGNQNDASLRQNPPQLGPQCRVPQHAVNGVDLPYFSAPSNGNVVDETLDVDLGFLQGSDYTIFAVERRWADAPTTSESEFVVGTTVPRSVELAGVGAWCNPFPANEMLAFGYSYNNGSPELLLTQGCGAVGGTVASVPATMPSSLKEETGRLDQSAGREVWVEGNPFGVDTSVTPLSYASGGAIGRAVAVTTALGFENRFRGDIAEVIVYDAALTDADRIAVEQYLAGHWHY